MYGNWEDPFSFLAGAFIALALGLVPLLAVIAFSMAALDAHDQDDSS